MSEPYEWDADRRGRVGRVRAGCNTLLQGWPGGALPPTARWGDWKAVGGEA